MHDVLDPRDLVVDEVQQLAESGYPVESLRGEARLAADRGDTRQLERIAAALSGLGRDPAWPYHEPDDHAELLAIAAGADRLPVRAAELPSRTTGAWLGRAIGNTLGKPVEGLRRDEVETYLRAAGQWPQTGYVPLLEPLPAGVSQLHPSAPVATAGRFTDVPRDDDIDWTILNLHVLERYGADVRTEDILREWLDRVPFTQTYTAERAAYRNATSGLRPPETASHRNPYREWIGAMIRGDAFGYVSPGDPGRAASLALRDACLSHVANGVYGEMWAAALVSSAFATRSAAEAVRASLAVVPPTSRLSEALRHVVGLREDGATWERAMAWVDEALGDYSWVHTINNAAVVVAALLWGDGFLDSVGRAVAAGRDTDSTAATVGSVFGALHGDSAIPPSLILGSPVRVRSAVRDFDRVSIDELAARTARLVALPAPRD